MAQEIALRFYCQQDPLYGVMHVPASAGARGVLVVVGGPQYRVGSHRQFVLLARALAEQGVACLRFDHRGVGDSDGTFRGFEQIDADIRAALDVFYDRVPALRDVVIWGLCDAASAALMYAPTDARVTGLVLANPWVRSEAGIARTYLRHYYGARLLDASFWRKLIHGELDVRAALGSFAQMVIAGMGRREGRKPTLAAAEANAEADTVGSSPAVSFTERMCDGLERFGGRTLFILSGDDLTAGEFKDLVAASKRWRRALDSARIRWIDFPPANHTFARREWRDQVATWTHEWLVSW